MPRAWRCYILFFFFPSQGQIIHLRLDLIYSSFSSWWKWKSMPIDCCPFHIYWHWSSETWTNMQPSESTRQTQPYKFSSVQQDCVCNSWGQMKLPKETKYVLGQDPGYPNPVRKNHLLVEEWVIEASLEIIIVFSMCNHTVKHLVGTLEATAWVLPAGWWNARCKLCMSRGSRTLLCALTEAVNTCITTIIV